MIIIILAELPFNCSLIFPKVHSEIYSKRSKPEGETYSPLSAHPKKTHPPPLPPPPTFTPQIFSVHSYPVTLSSWTTWSSLWFLKTLCWSGYIILIKICFGCLKAMFFLVSSLVANKWLHIRGQEFRRKCSLNSKEWGKTLITTKAWFLWWSFLNPDPFGLNDFLS